MDEKSSGLRRNIKLLYASYGGWSSFIKSEYTIVALVVTALCWRLIFDQNWMDLALSALPTLAGFSIAAYAIFFAVLDERARLLLRAPEPSLNNRSPLLILASSISHAVCVQILAILLAIVFKSKPFPYLECLDRFSFYVNLFVSFGGVFLTIYGIVLVLASILSIFRILEISTRV